MMENSNFVKKGPPLLTPTQLKERSKQLNINCDFEKIEEELQKQLRKENNIIIGQYNILIEDLRKEMLEKEKEKEYFENKIKTLSKDDFKLIQYEKEIISLNKNIDNLCNDIKKIEKDIKNLKK